MTNIIITTPRIEFAGLLFVRKDEAHTSNPALNFFVFLASSTTGLDRKPPHTPLRGMVTAGGGEPSQPLRIRWIASPLYCFIGENVKLHAPRHTGRFAFLASSTTGLDRK